jgi:RNA polymerase sigma-70 factor (ECF subfamily)
MALVGNPSYADDLVQDCIERALRRSAQLREIPRFSGWLRRILRNLYLDELRRGRHRGKEQDVDELADALELSAPASDRGAIWDLARALSQLSLEHREILLLVSLEELSYREIAEELAIPEGTVMSRLARARERLRSVMSDGSTKIAVFPPVKDGA